jgi:hypothetical protein
MATAALAGLAVTGIRPARAAAADDGELPPVPGMLGDRRANEVWYRLDEVALYRPSADLVAAYRAIAQHVGGNIESGFRGVWQDMSRTAGYPDNFAAFMEPIKEPLSVVSHIQLTVFDGLYRRCDPRLVSAFADFGQGVLYDPRRESVHSPVHTMDSRPGQPPLGYHTWHAYMRAMMLVGVDRHRWETFAPLNGFAWALQSLARPSMDEPSPPLPRETVLRQAARWLPRGMRQLDAEFQRFPYPQGIS